MSRLVVVFATLILLAGCMHRQLVKKATHQTSMLADLDQQQVLDNLALFASDLGALPYFAYASQGTASISDQSGLSVTNLLARQSQAQWQLTPVNDPRKLELMRCVYQRVIAMHRLSAMPAECPKCERLLKNFYTGDPEKSIEEGHLDSVTVDCLDGARWLAFGCKDCAAKRGGACVGRCGDVCVSVLPGRQEALTKLTLIILAFALHEPVAKPRKSAASDSSRHDRLESGDKP
ncbi:MAG TPA: hypothetical protein PK867_24370, partial [Pirellulales bacterium]|nr:hypothetical protein [Pirellulales bacterium]